MIKKTMLMLLLAFFTMSVSAETYPEVEEVQNTNEKKAIELPQWVQNIKFSVIYIRKSMREYSYHNIIIKFIIKKSKI